MISWDGLTSVSAALARQGCLEPNHDAEAVKTRKAVNVKASLFYNKEEKPLHGKGRKGISAYLG